MTDPVCDSQERWQRERRFLNARRHELAQAAQDLYPASWRVAGTPLLAPPEWIPAAPVPLDQVTLSWCPADQPRDLDGPGLDGPVLDGPVLDGPVLDGPVPESAAVRPLREDGSRFDGYADALGALTRPALFENRACYRILGVRALPGVTSLEFGPGRYFDMINTSEATAHEYAAAVLADGRPTPLPAAGNARNHPIPHPAAGNARNHPTSPPAAGELPLRSLIGDPAALRRRPVLAAIATLVLRADRARGQAQMILHWRDPARVATGGGLYQVAPVGMFQPSHDAAWNRDRDFSLWRCIVRELSEELLGSGEDYHSDSAPIDYRRWPLYTTLSDARRAGTLRVHWLGLGLDPLSLVMDMMSVAVFDAPLFDAVFAGLVSANAEGRIVTGEDAAGATMGLPFSAGSVERFTTAEPMQAAGAAVLRTAWRNRGTLLAC